MLIDCFKPYDERPAGLSSQMDEDEFAQFDESESDEDEEWVRLFYKATSLHNLSQLSDEEFRPKGPLREWLLLDRTRREIKKRFKSFLRTFTDDNTGVYAAILSLHHSYEREQAIR